MKVIILASVLITFASLSGRCSLSLNETNQNTNANSMASPSPSNISTAKAEIPPIPSEEMLVEIAALSKQAGIINLRDSTLPDSAKEIRLWKGGGLIIPQCFILKLQKDNPSAFLVAPKVVGNRGIFNKRGKPIYVKTTLESPASGWDEVINYLKSQGIDSSIKLSLDKTIKPDPDIQNLILEMKTGSEYSMVYYLDSTTSVDGRKAFSICQRMDQEFGGNVGCGS